MSGPLKSDWKVNPEGGFRNEYGENARRARAPGSATSQAQREVERQNGYENLPPPAADATDDAVRKRRAAAALQIGGGLGRQSTFLTKQLGEAEGGRTMLGSY